MTKSNSLPAPEAIYTNGRGAYAALIEDQLILPGGQSLTVEAAEDQGWDEDEDADATNLTAAAWDAFDKARRMYDDAREGRVQYEADKVVKAEAKAAYDASQAGRRAAASERAFIRDLNALVRLLPQLTRPRR